MKFNPYNYSDKHRLSRCVRRPIDPVVQPGLAMSPAEMMTAAQEGRPIGTMLLPDDQFEDGYYDVKWDVDILHRRGVDLIDAWTAEKEAKSSIRHKIDLAFERLTQSEPGSTGTPGTPGTPGEKGGE